VGEALDRFIRQQRVNTDIEEKVPMTFRNVPDETDVSSGSTQSQFDAGSFDYGDSIKKNNPLIQSILPINFQVELLVVRDTATNNLLRRLERTLEAYFETEYQLLVDENTNGISNSASETLQLGEIDLTLSLVDSKWQERRWRRLSYNPSSLMRGSSRSWRRDMQETRQSDTKLMTIDVDGSVNYSIEVDGSVPSPIEIERQWSEAYVDITSQNQLQRVIQDAGIEGVLSLEQVTVEDSGNQSNNDMPNDSTNGAGNGGYNGDETDTSNNEGVASLYENDENENGNESSEVNSIRKGSESQLERPSTLSIIFGFILTGIAVLGLFGYAYLFYRKRKKKLKKKKKMKESITANAAVAAAAAAASKKNQNNQYYSKKTPLSTKAPQSSQSNLNSIMLSQAESEETSYKGLGSSLGSLEDTSDPFAKELKLAASLDQEAWNESQRVKQTVERNEVSRVGSTKPMVGKNRNLSTGAPAASVLSSGAMRSKEAEMNAEGDEADLEGNPSWVKSFPYGDEPEPEPADQWEPYNSVLPPLLEEKKDETNPNEFFALKLNSIGNDVTASRGQSRLDANITDDTSDILSEVSELSKYVRRYEARKDRKTKREEYRNERLTAGQGMSIGMDGRVNQARSSNDYERTTPSSTKRMQPVTLSSYAGSFRDARNKETSINESMSFVSDDEDEEDISMRSQRLGISPYRRSTDEVYYKDGNLRNEEKSSSYRSLTSSSRMRSTRTEDDYRYSVGYSGDPSKSSSSRLADLRANDAIIDNSSSVVNYNIEGSTIPNEAIDQNKKIARSAPNEASGMSRRFARANQSKNTEDNLLAAKKQQSNTPRSPTSNRFNKLRGMFEQKSNEQPSPVYPPGENWQNAGSFGR